MTLNIKIILDKTSDEGRQNRLRLDCSYFFRNYTWEEKTDRIAL